MQFTGTDSAGTAVPSGELCPKSARRIHPLIALFLLFFLITLTDKALCTCTLNPGKHNTTPITGCTGYNPAQLSFTTLPSGGQPPYSYQWQLNNVPIPGETSPVYNPPQLTVAGQYQYNCSVTDALGTVAFTDAKLITIVPDPRVAISAGETICQNTLITITSMVTDGTGTISYQWLSSFDNTVYLAISGATGATFVPATSVSGILFYRVNIYPSVGSCNNAISAPSAITVISIPQTSSIYHR